ncbi:MAG: hypothetical protein WAN35_00875 [Terracidiphilus sp.]
MKFRSILAAACALLFAFPSIAQVAGAPPCVTGTLASYIALGEGGCMFGSVLYRDFNYIAASTADGADQILVTPAVLPFQNGFQGLNFSALTATIWSAPAGESKQSKILFNAVPFPPNAAALPNSAVLTLDLGGADVSGIIGSVDVKEVANAPIATNTAVLDVYDKCEDACMLKQFDSVSISPIRVLQSTITISLDGGTNGVSLSRFATDYMVGPQPE